MDYADATLVVLAEETGTDLVFTTDRRDFGVYRIRGSGSFRTDVTLPRSTVTSSRGNAVLLRRAHDHPSPASRRTTSRRLPAWKGQEYTPDVVSRGAQQDRTDVTPR